LGYGRVGELNPALTLQELLTQIQAQLAPPDLIFSPTDDLEQIINRVAVLGGSEPVFISDVVKRELKLI